MTDNTEEGDVTLRRVERATLAALTDLRRLDPALASDIDQLRRLGSVEPTVVVVGETKRGKSSLINALLGVPNLSPVAAAVATSSYLEFRHATAPYVRAHVPGADTPVSLRPADLVDWGTSLGVLSPRQRPPRRIEVGYPHPVLERLAVVDTPGVGGLNPVHAEIALDAASKATALLFVVDASAPMSWPELDFLARASRRIDDVLFVMTKIDAFPGWQTIADDNRDLLRRYAPRFAAAPFLPVSAKLAELAAKVTPVAAAELTARSGIPELREVIQRHVVERAELLHATNALRAVRNELAALSGRLAERADVTDPDPESTDRLRAERDRFASRRGEYAHTWTQLLSTGAGRAGSEASELLRNELRQLSEGYLSLVSSAEVQRLAALPEEVDRGLHAVSLRLSADLEQRSRSVARKVLEDVFAAGDLRHVLPQINAELRAALDARPRRETGDNQLLVVSSSAVMADEQTGDPLTTIALPVVNLDIGLPAGAFAGFREAEFRDRQHTTAWLREILRAAQEATEDEIAHSFAYLESALAGAVERSIGQRIEQLDQQISQATAAMAQDKAVRVKRRKALQTDRDTLRTRVQQLDDTLEAARIDPPGDQSSLPTNIESSTPP